jgi:hypothetical protein
VKRSIGSRSLPAAEPAATLALRASSSSRIALITAARLPLTPLPSLLNTVATRAT